jgi:hypothetical protein
MTGDMVFAGVLIALIFAFTAYSIWVMRRRLRLIRELQRMLDDARNAAAAAADASTDAPAEAPAGSHSKPD